MGCRQRRVSRTLGDGVRSAYHHLHAYDNSIYLVHRCRQQCSRIRYPHKVLCYLIHPASAHDSQLFLSLHEVTAADNRTPTGNPRLCSLTLKVLIALEDRSGNATARFLLAIASQVPEVAVAPLIKPCCKFVAFFIHSLCHSGSFGT